MNHSVIKCICAIIVGVLLVAWPEAAVAYLVIAIGALFFIPGLYALWGYLYKGRRLGVSFPLVGVGSALFGLWLMINPAFFVGILMYILGAVLAFAGISQLVNLVSARTWTQVPIGYYIVPILVLLAGLLVLVNPFAAASVPFLILGLSSIVYGVSELINLLRFKKNEDKSVNKEVEIVDVTPIEE